MNTTPAEYDANLAAWTRARRVMAGEDAVKAAGEAFLPRLELQTDAEYAGYKARASFFNATSRTADGFVGLIFRRAPFVRLPDAKTGVGLALQRFENDVDLSGTTLGSYAQQMVRELVEVGRAGTLVDWEGGLENRAYVSLYAAEDILNWRVERVNGRNLTTLVVLAESAEAIALRQTGEDSILGNLSCNAGVFLTQILAWVYWWNTTVDLPDGGTSERVLVELNTDFSAVGLGAQADGRQRRDLDG